MAALRATHWRPDALRDAFVAAAAAAAPLLQHSAGAAVGAGASTCSGPC